MGLIPIVVIGVAVAVAAGIHAWRAEQKRQEELFAFATERGFSLRTAQDSLHDDEYAHFEIFRRGHSRVAQNTLTGRIAAGGRDLYLKAGDFEYQVTSSDGKRQYTSTHRFSYAIVHLPFRTPDLLIRREGVLDKLAGALGFDDIDFESEEFSRSFHVKSDDRRFAFDVIHPRMMEFLLASPPGVVDVERGQICLADGARRWSAAQFRERLAFLSRFVELWPEHLVRSLSAGGGSAGGRVDDAR